MKSAKNYLILIFALATLNLNAQSDYDAYLLSTQRNEGTARSVAMGNAMTALGGDIGAIAINPAASAIYRYHELVFTPSITESSNSSDYLGTNLDVSKTRFGIANFGYVATFDTWRKHNGLVSWNLGITFNKLNNFTDKMSAMGRNGENSWLQPLAANLSGLHATNLDYNDFQDPFYKHDWKSVLGWNTSALDTLPDSGFDYIATTENIDPVNNSIMLGGELDQYFIRESIGNVSQVDINFGGNISNTFFFGVNLGVVSIWHKYSEFYSESAVNSADFQTGFSSFNYEFLKKTSGTGVNMRAGFIFKPFPLLSIGASISTPTWMFLHEEYQENMSTKFSNGDNPYLLSPIGEYNYRLNTPFRWNVGLALVFGSGALSVDYERVDYSNMKLEDEDFPGTFADANMAIKRYYKSQDIIRAGGEFQFNRAFAVRAGYQYYNSGYQFDDSSADLHIGSVGIGYTSQGGFFADITYQQNLKNNKTEFSLYDDIYDGNTLISAAPVGLNKYNNWKLLVSIGFRF